MQITAKKGVKLFHDFYIDMDIKPYFVPQTIKLPLGFSNDKIEYKKNVGDIVERFDVVALVNNIPVYSSVNGRIVEFCSNKQTDYLPIMNFAIIKTDGTDKPTFPLWETKADYSKDELLNIIKKAGIVNKSLKDYFVNLINLSTQYKKLIIDVVDDQPYDLSKTALILNYEDEILRGAEILAKTFNIPCVEMLIMKNFRTADFIKNSPQNFNIVVVNGKYPLEPEIVQYAYENTALRVGVECCRAVYRAAYFGEPQTTNVLTVWGEGVEKPKIFEVLNGTPTNLLLQKCEAKGILERVVAGGVMNGYVISPELPSLRWDDAITVMPFKKHKKGSYCVNCGRCADVCPMKLAPYFILRSSNRKSEEIAKQLTAGMCIFCGACSYICPSRQPLVQKIREYNNYLYRGSGNE